jgi:drug/metabolite transporter (DMT)-like permease
LNLFGSFRLPLLAFVCALLWGSAFPVIKIVYAGWESNSLELRLCFAGIRFIMAGLLILPFCGRSTWYFRGAWLKWLLLLAFTQTFLQYVFFYSGLAVSSGVLGAVLVGTGSLWWIVLAPILLKSSRPKGRHLWVVFVGLTGVVIAVYAPGIGSGNPLVGTGLFLGATLSGALAAIVIIPLSKWMDVRLATSGSLFIGGVGLLLCGGRALPSFIEMADARLLLTTLYLAGVSAGAFGIWNWLVGEYSVNVLAGYRFLIPLSGAVQSVLFIAGESPGPGIVFGGFIILGSLIYLHRIEVRLAAER